MPLLTKRPIKHFRWYIAGLLCLASQLNYLDRQTLSVLASTIQNEFHLTDLDYSVITTTFLWAYAVSYAVSGYIVDWLGARRSFLMFVSGWSVANMLHVFARSLAGLAFFRGLLALMESANFPAGIKAVTEWFPMRERALAVGIFNAGTAVGNAVAVPIVAFLTIQYGWRSAFVFTGALGLIWVMAWALIYRQPQKHSRLSEEERNLILDGREENAVKKEKIPIFRLLQMPQAWGCMLARLLTDPISYFLFFWTPKYLQDVRGFNLKEVAIYAWIPFAALTLGNLFSGAMPRFLISCGWPLSRARKTTMLYVSIGMMVVCLLMTRVASPVAAISLLAAIMFGHAAWGNITLPAETFHGSVVGTVTGFGGCLGGVAGGITQLIIGSVVMKFGYGPIFAACSVMYLIALGGVHFLIGELGVAHKVRSTNEATT